MQAIILAGGKGTRLRPYTITIPKPLVPVNDTPILEIVIKQLCTNGFKEIILAVGHQAELIQAYFKNGEKYGVSIEYSYEDSPLGTAGPLKKIKKLDDNFLVLNSDDLTDLSYKLFFETHINNGNLLTIASYTRNVQIDMGVIEEKNSRLTKYIEKPTYNYKVSTGIYAFDRKAINYIPDNEYYDFPTLVHTLIDENEGVGVYQHEGYWLDIGRPEDYELANNDHEKLSTLLQDI